MGRCLLLRRTTRRAEIPVGRQGRMRWERRDARVTVGLQLGPPLTAAVVGLIAYFTGDNDPRAVLTAFLASCATIAIGLSLDRRGGLGVAAILLSGGALAGGFRLLVVPDPTRRTGDGRTVLHVDRALVGAGLPSLMLITASLLSLTGAVTTMVLLKYKDPSLLEDRETSERHVTGRLVLGLAVAAALVPLGRFAAVPVRAAAADREAGRVTTLERHDPPRRDDGRTAGASGRWTRQGVTDVVPAGGMLIGIQEL